MAASLSHLCRLCGADTKNIKRNAIFDGEGCVKKYANKITECLTLQVKEEDQLPKVMCGECSQKLDLLSDFRDTAYKTESAFLTMVADLEQIKDEPEVDDNPFIDFSPSSPEMEMDLEQLVIKEDEPPPPPPVLIEKRPVRQAALKHLLHPSKEQVPAKKSKPPKKTVLKSTPPLKEIPKSTGPKWTSTRVVTVSAGVFGCYLEGCTYTSTRRTAIYVHVRHVHLAPRYVCDFCGRRYKRHHMAQHLLRTHLGVQPQLACPVAGCERVLHSLLGLKDHVARHSAPQVACGACARVFHTRTQLRVHTAARHATERRHMCAECGATFVTRQQLTNHTQTHAAGRPHACPVAGCFHASKTIAGLNSHRLSVHPVVQRSECSECGHSFKTKWGLVKHSQRVHGAPRPASTAAKSFECGLCGHRPKTAWHLRQHLLQHENARRFECDVCKKRFNTVTLLKMHLQAVHLAAQLVCHECGLPFRSKLALEAHRLRHTGEKPFKCPYCHVCFRQKSTRDKHKKTQHKHQTALEHKQRCWVK